MSDFWSQFSAPPSSTPSATAPATALPWWQQTTAPAAPSVPAPTAPTQQPQQEVAGARAMELVQWAKGSQDVCPGCMSSNYGTHPSQPKARPRCFDCGFPLSQSGSGVTLRGENVGPVKAARQTQASKTNSFNPQNIFQHIG